MKKTRPRKPGQWLWFEPVYRVNYALLSCPADEAKLRIRRLLPFDVCEELDETLSTLKHCDGRFIASKHDTSGLVISFWIGPTSDVAVIAHEAFHAVTWLLKDKGMRHDDSSDEAYAYLMEWLMREILKRIA